MPVGMVLLLVVAALIFFGFLQRVLDRMHMDDMTAIIFIGAMILGTFLPNIPLPFGVSINLGGGVVPIIISLYLIINSDSPQEKTRAIVAALITGGAIFITGRFLPAEPENMIIDPVFAYSILAGLIAYIFGRSRRGAFIASILGMVISDILYAAGIGATPTAQTVIGGAGIFDSIVISGILAVGLCEIGGETLERIQGGSYAKKEKAGPERMEVSTKGKKSVEEGMRDENEEME